MRNSTTTGNRRTQLTIESENAICFVFPPNDDCDTVLTDPFYSLFGQSPTHNTYFIEENIIKKYQKGLIH